MEGREADHPPSPDASRVGVARWPTKRVVVAAACLAAVALGWTVLRPTRSDSPSRAEVAGIVKKAVDSAVSSIEDDAAAAPQRSVLAYRRVLPSVVFITTDEATINRPRPTTIPPSSTEPENGATQDDGDGGLGTGVIINSDGIILTANHVVANAKIIKVTFADGTSADATIESAEPERDLAVLRPSRTPEVVVPAVMGGGVAIGDETYAIGHPLGLVDSFSSGVISGLNRSIPTEDGTVLEGLIQFDAAVNPGNSGGPLLNRNGQVVGIVTALANPAKTGFFVGIGFAVPIAEAGSAAGGPPK